MSVKIQGIKELEAKLRDMLPSKKASASINKAVNLGGDKVVRNLQDALTKFKDTGATKDEVVRTNVRGNALNDDRSLKIGWNGPKSRASLIHLNEFGYSKDGYKYRPSGFGAIERVIKESEEDYFSIVYNELRRVYNG